MSVTLAVIDRSRSVEADEVSTYLPAWQRQVSEHFAPVWGEDARVLLVGKGEQAPRGAWKVVLLDSHRDVPFLGLHRVGAQRRPFTFAYVNKAKDSGVPLSALVSHEILEVLANPDVNICHWVERKGRQPLLYLREVADPCQADYYDIDGVPVSNFIYPSWFELHRRRTDGPFDHMGLARRPFHILPGGYQSVCRVDDRPRWVEIDASYRPLSLAKRGKPWSRRARRAGREE